MLAASTPFATNRWRRARGGLTHHEQGRLARHSAGPVGRVTLQGVSSHETLGLLLVREGLISRPDLYEALRAQRQTGELLGSCLLHLGLVRPEALLGVLARQLGIPALPPGSLGHASQEAVRMVPRALALRLRVLPYSWDGRMLGVAVADGRVLSQLQDVAQCVGAPVGAYVALETEIDAALQLFYGEHDAASARPIDLSLRPRPPQVMTREGALELVNAEDLGPALLKTAKATLLPRPAAPLERAAAAPSRAPSSKEAAHVIASAPPLATARTQLERLSFLEAVEKIYEAVAPEGVAERVGQALLNYFSRVIVLLHDGERLRVVGSGGVTLRRVDVPSNATPLLTSRRRERNVAYGLANMDVRAAELTGVFGFAAGATALIAAVNAARPPSILAFADNATNGELYEDLHDIEMLFKEAETGLCMVLDKPG